MPATRSKSSARSRVVVFDIDDTLCCKPLFKECVKFAKENHAECPIIETKFRDSGNYEIVHTYVFLPYLGILFDFLIERGIRIAFFSSGSKERNGALIPLFLTSLLGSHKYNELKSLGQFDVFSENDMRMGLNAVGWENHIKDLGVVIRDGESISDAILVDDVTNNAALDQLPHLHILGLNGWKLFEKDYGVDEYSNSFPMNSTYYMLGVFKTYLEDENYKKMPLREGLDKILPEVEELIRKRFSTNHPFTYSMIDKGLSEVQKLVPNAKFYGHSLYRNKEN